MPSTLQVELRRIDDVQVHPNADRLMLATIGGWQCVVGKSDDGTPERKKGDLVVFVPPDSVMPKSLADSVGVTKYLAEKTNKDGQRVLVVRAKKMRGELSSGVILDPPIQMPGGPVDQEGDDLADVFGITKFEAPVRATSSIKGGQPSQEHPMFWKYDGPENYRHWVGRDVIVDGETVVITEKIHGSNGRVGIVDGEWMAGSNKVQRKNPAALTVINDIQFVGTNDGQAFAEIDADKAVVEDVQQFASADVLDKVCAAVEQGKHVDLPGYQFDTTQALPADWWRNDAVAANTYWFPTTLPGVRSLCEALAAKGHKQVILYGEIYGPSIFFPYGKKQHELGFAAFDLLVDGKYLDWVDFARLCMYHGVDTVPHLYVGPFHHSVMQTHVSGTTTFNGDSHCREGIVVKPTGERRHQKVGRSILKYVSDEFLDQKDRGKVADATDE